MLSAMQKKNLSVLASFLSTRIGGNYFYSKQACSKNEKKKQTKLSLSFAPNIK